MKISDMSPLDRLKLDLSIKEDNKHNISELGGNAAQLYYLMTQNITVKIDPNFNSAIFKLIDNNNLTLILANTKISELIMRKALDNFLSESSINYNKDISFSLMTDLFWLNDFAKLTPEVIMLKKAVDIISKMQPNLIKNLINEDEITNIQIVNSMPAHIATLTFRMLVGVEKIIILHLDKLMEFPS